MTLGQRIQKLRKERNLSQEALGEAMGVSRQAISKWEGDLTTPELDKLVALSKLFELPVGQLLGVERPAEPASEGKCKEWRRWLAGLAALCLVLAVAAGLLWGENRRLERQILTLEDTYVYSAKPLFEWADCQLGDLALGFPLARGSEDLQVDLKLKPVKELKGWELLGVDVTVQGHDPWGHPAGERDWEERIQTSAERRLWGPYTASFTIPDYGGEKLTINAVFQENGTGRIAEVEELFRIESVYSRQGNFAVEEVNVTEGSRVARLPRSLDSALRYPADPRFDN